MPVELDTVLKRIILVFAVLALVLITFVAKFESITDPNVADYAQIARHVSRGEGFITSAPSPLSLSQVPGAARHPELGRPPLYVCALAGVMRVVGATDRAVALTSTLFFLATLLLTYFIARRAFSDQVGIFAMLLCLLAAPLLAQAVSGADTALLTFLVTLLFGLLFWREKAPDREAWRWPVLAGVVLGLAYLTRYETAALLPAVACYFWLSQRKARWRNLGLLLAAFAVIVAPWIIRSSLLVGRPFISLAGYEAIMLSDLHPMQTLYRTFAAVPNAPWLEALRNPLEMLKKLNQGLQVLYGGVSQVVNPFLMPFFIVGLILGSIRRRFALLQWCFMLALVSQVIVLSVYMPLSRLLLPFTPLMAIVAVAWFCSLLDDYLSAVLPADLGLVLARRRATTNAKKRRRVVLPVDRDFVAARRRFLALVAWTVIVGYPLTSYLFTTPAAQEHPIVRICQKLGQEKAGLIASDIPWFIAWYGDKNAMLLPTYPQDLPGLAAVKAEPDVVYLSPGLMQMPAEEGMRGWQELLVRQGNLAGFKRVDWNQSGALWRRDRTAPVRP